MIIKEHNAYFNIRILNIITIKKNPKNCLKVKDYFKYFCHKIICFF